MKLLIEPESIQIVISLEQGEAITEYCWDCSRFYHRSVESCFLKDCPLHPYRNGNGKYNYPARRRAIFDKCLLCRNKNEERVRGCRSLFCPLHFYRTESLGPEPEFGKLYDSKSIPIKISG